MERTLSSSEMTKCFNEWMVRFVKEPEKFQHEWETVFDFLKDDYGAACTKLMFKIKDELDGQTF